jgi:hypothetical protein
MNRQTLRRPTADEIVQHTVSEATIGIPAIIPTLQ